MTIPEYQRLMNASEAQFRPLVQAALQTGCRYGELHALKAQDFNPESGTIHIRTSKSGKARHVILTAEGVKLFKRLTAGLGRDALILQRDDGSPWKLGLQGRRIADACARANIDPPNAACRSREYLTPAEVASLIEAARRNRKGHRVPLGCFRRDAATQR
jgi:integrase